jgi:ACS family hexuronate transporter-like MFS transporter
VAAQPVDPATPKMKWYKEWGKLMTYRQTWSFATGKFLTDGVWWFFLFWLPAYLKAVYGMTGTDIMLPIAVLYTMTCVGSIGGGAFPMYFIRKGYEPYGGRMRAMIIIAFFPLVVLLAQPFGSISYWVPVILIGIGASAHQAWSANIFTTVSDMFPKKTVASVTGIGGMAGGVGGIIINKVGGWIFDAYRASGIADFWEKVKGTDLAGLAETVKNTEVMNRHGQIVNLNIRELGDLPREAMMHLQSNTSLSMEQINQLIEFQKPIVQSHMSASYAIMFGFCAVAYLIAWVIMKTLVPRYKPITDL